MSTSHCITNPLECQEPEGLNFLSDKGARGRERPWRVHKLNAEYIAIAYEDINMSKSDRVQHCADTLVFGRADGKLKLKRANFCRVRLCPMCGWRRSLKTHAHMSRILEAAKPLQMRYLMVTLTVKNVSADELSGALDELFHAYKLLVQRTRIKNAWRGWYRGVEITHNKQDDTYHPHIHALVAVDKSYFKSKKYIRQDELTELWRECLRANYTPIVDIRKTYGDSVHAVSEVAKYATKVGDIVDFDDWGLTVQTLDTLDKALDKRRLIAFGGEFKRLHAELNLDDTEDGDLVHLDCDELQSAGDDVLYFWHTGLSSYIQKT